MTGDQIPDSNHVARYCSATRITEDGRVSGAAFQLRRAEEYLSADWIEKFQSADRSTQIVQLRLELSASGFKLGATAKFAVLNVGMTIETVRAGSLDRRVLNFIHKPLKGRVSHSGIYGIPEEDLMIGELIAQSIVETYLAKPV